ncbi:ABC transporter substrate-binding protein [Actinocrispum wychmicini]|uniref:Peptide/nickel transport system substrate-binding protein n=1 Tax=Actinocrispum wychmicini TaxID=1213861 RepID=A0A4R2JTK4_9PSEU|nr:ABC transporter substrate-binding protein [Actinocrispum wychmicini]TCO62322.1 peptide/nickel transport system substrate-binding protein [Actinocrispum wychmicini]
MTRPPRAQNRPAHAHRYRGRQVLILFSAVLAGATGCSSDAAPRQPAAGGTLTFATDTEPGCLDPQVSGLDVNALIDRNIFDSLVNMAPDGTFHPWLATSWEVSSDGTRYTFHLRADVVFQDGTKLTAEAVKATFDHAVDPKTKSQYAASLIRPYAGSRVIDDNTVEMTLAAPSAPFLQAVSTAYMGIQSAKSLQAGGDGPCQRPVGSGPFKFDKWAQGQSITMSKYPAYNWASAASAHNGAAYLDGLTISFIKENAVRAGALTSHQADVIANVLPTKVKSIESSADLQVYRTQPPGVGYALYFNTTSAPMTDERVRKALLRSVDVDALVKSIYFDQYPRAWNLLNPPTLDYDKALEQSWPYDPAMANKLLDDAGWTTKDADGFRTKDGKRLTVRWPYLTQFLREQRDVLGQGIQDQAKQVGIDLQRIGEDAATYRADLHSGNTHVWDQATVRADPDILRTLFAADQTSDKGGFNVFELKDPQLDKWLTEAVRSSDPAVRKDRYTQVQHYLVDHAMVMPLYVPESLVGAAKRVRGLTFEAAGYPLFYDVSLDGT